MELRSKINALAGFTAIAGVPGRQITVRLDGALVPAGLSRCKHAEATDSCLRAGQHMRKCLLATLAAPEACHRSPSSIQRAQGRPGGRCTRGPRAENNCASARTTGTAVITPAFPAQWFYGLYVISSVNLADCHRRPSRSLRASLWT